MWSFLKAGRNNCLTVCLGVTAPTFSCKNPEKHSVKSEAKYQDKSTASKKKSTAQTKN